MWCIPRRGWLPCAGVGEAEIAAATTDNFFRLFKKVPRSAASIPSSA